MLNRSCSLYALHRSALFFFAAHTRASSVKNIYCAEYAIFVASINYKCSCQCYATIAAYACYVYSMRLRKTSYQTHRKTQGLALLSRPHRPHCSFHYSVECSFLSITERRSKDRLLALSRYSPVVSSVASKL